MCNMSGQSAWPGLQLNYFLHSSSSHNRMGDQFSTSSVEQLRLLITYYIFCGFLSAFWHVAYFAWRRNISNRKIVYFTKQSAPQMIKTVNTLHFCGRSSNRWHWGTCALPTPSADCEVPCSSEHLSVFLSRPGDLAASREPGLLQVSHRNEILERRTQSYVSHSTASVPSRDTVF